MFLFITILLFSITASGPLAPDSSASDNKVVLISVKGSISPTATNYIQRGIKVARKEKAECLIIQLDTPGGLLESMKNIVQSFLDSHDLPIVVYVAPEGASAASAGTFITIAAHIAAMAPTTNIGAASPVQMGGGTPDSVMQKKLFNYSESYIETIANRRHRNAEWAISAVRDGKSVTAEKALELNVIDLIAKDRNQLLQKIDGRVVDNDTLHTKNAVIEELPTNLTENFLAFIMRPEVMLILTLIAIYGIIGEVTNPGAIIPGISGAIALILVLYASAAMPINIAGFALIGLAIILFIAEAFTPTFGILIAGGAVSFFLGALMLFQDLPVTMRPSWVWLIPATILTTLFFIWIVTQGIRAQFISPKTGLEAMIGRRVKVIEKVQSDKGRVFVNGEYWNAVSDNAIEKGEEGEITGINGLTLTIRSLDKSDQTKINSTS
ncbi:MAG TPA: nodulation protein NfeD [Balneolaceae bacterium]|nr:nodulation protein NfeD [Balneolaceae bacterium]